MTTILAARALIVHQKKLFLVRHHGSDFYALPGGKLEDNESMKDALIRELKEELGVEAKVGPLLYINEFRYPQGAYSVEFFYWIENAEAFVDAGGGEQQEHELAEFGWFDALDRISLLPKFLEEKYADLEHGPPEHIEHFSTVT